MNRQVLEPTTFCMDLGMYSYFYALNVDKEVTWPKLTAEFIMGNDQIYVKFLLIFILIIVVVIARSYHNTFPAHIPERTIMCKALN